jgi:hypothetical protein
VILAGAQIRGRDRLAFHDVVIDVLICLALEDAAANRDDALKIVAWVRTKRIARQRRDQNRPSSDIERRKA